MTNIYLGLDVGKTTHHATALTSNGKKIWDKPLPQAKPKIRELLEKLNTQGTVLLVADQPKTIGALPVAIAQDAGIEVAYLPGLTIRRVADLHPGEAKTDARDALSAVIRSMPGMGVRTSARILTEVVGKDFKDASHLASYAGIASVDRKSGTSIKGSHASRRGNKALKRVLFLSAFALLKADQASRAYYDRKCAEGKRHNQAVMALARKRLNVLFAMLRDGCFYECRVPVGV